MPYVLNDKIKNLVPYSPIQGEYNIRLDANESFICVDYEKLSPVFKQCYNRYPDPYATNLCKAFSNIYKINENNVVAGNGSDELISLLMGAFFTYGDTVLTLSHDFSMYKFYGDVFGINTTVFEKNSDLTIDVDALIKHINTNKLSGVIFSNPCNPTSLSLSRQEVIKLVESVDALVIVDEAYMDFYDQSILDVCCDYDNVIVLKTCSKAIGLASIRLGFAVANDVIINALKAVKSPYNVNTITQAVGEFVLSDKKYIQECIQALVKSRDFLYNELVELKNKFGAFEIVYKPTTNFIFIKATNAKYIFEKLLEQSIAIRNMGEFLRITAGTTQENKQLISALTKILISES